MRRQKREKGPVPDIGRCDRPDYDGGAMVHSVHLDTQCPAAHASYTGTAFGSVATTAPLLWDSATYDTATGDDSLRVVKAVHALAHARVGSRCT